MAKKAYEESNIANIAVAIREKTGSNQTYKTSEMPSGINEVYEKGCVDGYNDGYTKGDSEGYDKGYDIGYTDGFNSAPPDYLLGITSLTFYDINIYGKETLTLNIPQVTSCYRMLSVEVANEIVKHIIINAGDNVTSMGFMIYGRDDYTLKRLTLNFSTSNVTNFTYCFFRTYALEIIDGTPLDASNANDLNGTFSNCRVLKEVRFVPLSIKNSVSFNSCTDLSPETIQSIIDGLADLTGETAQTLTLHADVGAKLTNEQKAVITVKNWILAY